MWLQFMWLVLAMVGGLRWSSVLVPLTSVDIVPGLGTPIATCIMYIIILISYCIFLTIVKINWFHQETLFKNIIINYLQDSSIQESHKI